jgi:hypothetical protein
MAKDRIALHTSDMARRVGTSSELCPAISAANSGGIRDPTYNEHYILYAEEIQQTLSRPGRVRHAGESQARTRASREFDRRAV